jgi:hypothetical protein
VAERVTGGGTGLLCRCGAQLHFSSQLSDLMSMVYLDSISLVCGMDDIMQVWQGMKDVCNVEDICSTHVVHIRFSHFP